MQRDLMQGDPAIVKLLQRDESIRQKMATGSYYFDRRLFESAFERRRLRILNAIFLAFARTGSGGRHFQDRQGSCVFPMSCCAHDRAHGSEA
ncbi:hypothetical protein [Pseudorhodoplanes sp.]|uniref:hypothetical protein n=1 Tax=Pseudorhodoplanes sp. TaxID=1934341 RepID=UPI003D0D1945